MMLSVLEYSTTFSTLYDHIFHNYDIYNYLIADIMLCDIYDYYI